MNQVISPFRRSSCQCVIYNDENEAKMIYFQMTPKCQSCHLVISPNAFFIEKQCLDQNRPGMWTLFRKDLRSMEVDGIAVLLANILDYGLDMHRFVTH